MAKTPLSPPSIRANAFSAQDAATGPADLADLVRSRQEAIAQVTGAREAGAKENEFAAAERLYQIDRQILLRADELPESQQGDVDTLRDHFLGLSTWLADRYETTDLASTLEREAQAILARSTTELQQTAVRRLNADLERVLR